MIRCYATRTLVKPAEDYPYRNTGYVAEALPPDYSGERVSVEIQNQPRYYGDMTSPINMDGQYPYTYQFWGTPIIVCVGNDRPDGTSFVPGKGAVERFYAFANLIGERLTRTAFLFPFQSWSPPPGIVIAERIWIVWPIDDAPGHGDILSPAQFSYAAVTEYTQRNRG